MLAALKVLHETDAEGEFRLTGVTSATLSFSKATQAVLARLAAADAVYA